MTDTLPLLRSKLEIPINRSGMVSRNRLNSRLSKGILEGCKLTLISAPAGYGKTTLVSDWIATQPMDKAWVSLEAADGDPVRFWKYLATSLQSIHEGLGVSTLNSLKAAQVPPLQMVLTQLINDLNKLKSDVLLVLDDYHQLSSTVVHESLTFFMNHCPLKIHLVIITRTDPPLPIAQLRVKGQLNEVRGRDLKFTSSEINSFFSSLINVELTDRDIALLEERTEGWAAGIQLAAISLRHENDITGFISSFAGDNRYILDYLLDEVLNRQRPEIRSFLLQTSILEMLSGPLCDAVTRDKFIVSEESSITEESCGNKEHSSLDILQYLETTNLFVIPLDHRREWYRYHHLFSDLLRYQLKSNPPMGCPQSEILHNRAADWYKTNGYPAQAVNHFLYGNNIPLALDLIETLAWPMIQNGEHATVAGWLEAIDDQAIFERPGLCIKFAWALNYMGNTKDYGKYLEAARTVFERNNDSRLGEVYNLVADMKLVSGAIDEGRSFAKLALDYLAPDDDFNRGLSFMYLGFVALLHAEGASALQYLEKAKQLCLASDNVYGYSRAVNAIIQVHVAQGKLRQGEELCRQFMDTIGESIMYILILNHIMLSAILMEQNRISEACHHLESALSAIDKNTYNVYFTKGYLILAWLRHLIGDDESALELIKRAENNAYNLSSSVLLSQIYVMKAKFALAHNNLVAANRWIETSGLNVNSKLNPYLIPELIVVIRIAIENNNVHDILPLIEKLDHLAKTKKLLGQQLKIMVLRSMIYKISGNTKDAMKTLSRAIELGEPNGFIRVFADEGPVVRELLIRMKPEQQYITYVERIVEAFDVTQLYQDESKASLSQNKLREPLTVREQELLELIASGLSNQAIADKLFISLNTVKVHLKNIYRKLGISSRTQAMAKAIDLNIISV